MINILIVKEIFPTYILCASPRGELQVQRPFKLRSENIKVGNVTYESSGSQTRTAREGNFEQIEVVVPKYSTGDRLLCTMVDGHWYDLNIDARAWAVESGEPYGYYDAKRDGWI